MADRLLRQFRARAESVLDRHPRPWCDPKHVEARDTVYRVIDEVVSDLADRIERESDPVKRNAAVDVLLLP
jgi:hypothetical protein